MKARYYLALVVGLAVVGAFLLPSGRVAMAQTDTVVVTSDESNVRSAPSTSSSIVTTVSQGDVVSVTGTVSGEEVVPGNDSWYETAAGHYLYSGQVNGATDDGQGASGSLSGRWIDADLSTATVSAMQGSRVVYSALSTVGTPDNPTPVGDFTILRKVYDETMDSSTIGIPSDAPGGYYLTGVLYTQYFTDGGAALHYNYWSPASAFGSQAGSHGCLGLDLADSAFFWNFADVGTPVIIHY